MPANHATGRMRIAIVTDAWHPQRNGVVRVLDSVRVRVAALGHDVAVIGPDRFRSAPMPGYPEIRLALLPHRRLAGLLAAYRPDAVHIATEGPLGWAARRWCRRRAFPFTTAYHSRFPEYVRARLPVPLAWSYAVIRRFHAPAAAVLVPTERVRRELAVRGIGNLRDWSHGVDTGVFRPQPKDVLDLPRPIHLYVGRLAVEKNLPAFLGLDLPGSKVVVGDGPERRRLMTAYPDAHFFIADGDAELARYYAAADVFVFPSRTDTFGLVMLEALACGVPVAAFPVPGPLDVLGSSGAGVLDEDLARAAAAARTVPPDRCRARALALSWDAVARQFLGYLAPVQRGG